MLRPDNTLKLVFDQYYFSVTVPLIFDTSISVLSAAAPSRGLKNEKIN